MRRATLLLTLAAVAVAGGADQARSLFLKGDFKGAKETAQRLVEKDETNGDAWLVLADALLKLDEPADAWTALERGITAVPASAMLRMRLGDTFLKMAELETRTSQDGTTIRNYYSDAARMYDEALGIDPKAADAIYGKAYVAYNLQDTENARKLLADCLGVNKDHAKAHALQAFMLYNDKKYAEAATKYEIALKVDDGDPVDMVRYGHCFYAQGKSEEAKNAYIAALKRHPTDDTAIRSGLYYVSGKDWRKTEGVLKEATEQAPKSAPVWYYFGYAKFVNGSYDEARDAYRKASEIDPKNATYVYSAGYAQEKLGDAQEALDAYRKALKADPAFVEAAQRFEGMIRMQANFDAVEKLYEELLLLAPENADVRNNFALTLRDWAEARGAAKDANPPADVKRRIKRSGEVYEMAAALLPDEAQLQSDTGLLFDWYPCNRNDEKAIRYARRSMEAGNYTCRDGFNVLDRACRRAGDWETLADYAERVLVSLEDQGLHAIAPTAGGQIETVKHDTPRMIAVAKKAIADAKPHLKKAE